MHERPSDVRPVRPPRRLGLLAAGLVALLAPATAADGSDEAVVLIVDPADAESMYVANYYKAMRNVPDGNVVWVEPGAASYAQLAAVNVEAFLGTLANAGIEHVDYVVVPPGGSFFVGASGLVTDSCFPVNRFSIAAGYMLAYQRPSILSGLPSEARNHYAPGGTTWTPAPFDGSGFWTFGLPAVVDNGRRYFVGAMLGYTGPNGNTLSEVLDMIDRSVAADATAPVATAYFMETTDVARSSPRDPHYPAAVTEMSVAGGAGQHLLADLPVGQHDAMGVMTGRATLDIAGADMTLLPGSFADHLTSFAGTFTTTSQTKMSEWIKKGASGTAGTVEEPCNYSGKFPHARLHVLYRRGQTLGSAWLRSMYFLPFQNLLYGDPLTRPYARPVAVDVPSPPVGPVSGLVTITPTAVATAPGAGVARVELYVDGVLTESEPGGASFTLNTTALEDGWHELRVLAHDDSDVAHTGRWIGALTVDNFGRSVSLATVPLAGDLATRFDATVGAAGGPVDEVRLLSGGRVVAAAPVASATLSTFGQNLGAGPLVRVQAEALFADGRRARSAPLDLAIAYSPGTPAGGAPVAFGYRKRVRDDVAYVLELPAAFDEDPAGATFTLVQPPAQSTVLSAGAGPYRVLAPDPGASGTDVATFEVTTSGGTSSLASIEIEYAGEPVTPYGCIAPAGSLVVVSGTPVIGTTLVLGVDNPIGTQLPPGLPFLALADAPDPSFPCGTTLPGLGMLLSGLGELLVDLGPPNPLVPVQVGPTWTGTGQPAPFAIGIPSDPSLVGLRVYAQGLLLEPAATFGVKLGVTNGLEIELGG